MFTGKLRDLESERTQIVSKHDDVSTDLGKIIVINALNAVLTKNSKREGDANLRLTLQSPHRSIVVTTVESR